MTIKTKNKYIDYLGEAKKSLRHKRLKSLEHQNFQCSICRTALSGGKDTCWDHDHKTGNFRAWLCQACNKGLGFFKDNPEVLRKAAQYIELHSL